MSDVLVLYYSSYGATEALAREVCLGVDSVPGMASRLRTVAPVSAVTEASEPAVPEDGPPYVSLDDLDEFVIRIIGDFQPHCVGPPPLLQPLLDQTQHVV